MKAIDWKLYLVAAARTAFAVVVLAAVFWGSGGSDKVVEGLIVMLLYNQYTILHRLEG